MSGLALVGLVVGGPAWADPIKTHSALTTGFAAAPFRVGAESAGSSGLITSGSPIAGSLLGSGSGRVFTFAIPVTLTLPLDDRTLLTATIPLLTMDAENLTTRQTIRSSDWGDLTMTVKHAVVVADTPARLARVALTGGLRLPTGPDGQVNAESHRLPPRLQQGFGSFGAVLGVSGSLVEVTGRCEAHAALTYKTDAEANDFRPGDRYTLDLAVGYRRVPGGAAYDQAGQTTALLELNAEIQKWDMVMARKVSGTKHEAVFVTPGLQAIVTSHVLIEAAYQFPVFRYYEGEQILPDYVARLGIRVRS